MATARPSAIDDAWAAVRALLDADHPEASLLEPADRLETRFRRAPSGVAVHHHAGQVGDLCDPATVVLAFDLDSHLITSMPGRNPSIRLGELSSRQCTSRAPFAQAGFSSVMFRRFPGAHRHLDLWGHIVEAQE